VLLLGVEVGVARRDWPWAREPHSDAGVVDALETQVIARAADPVVLLLGSSRMRDAIAPRTLERALGLRPGQVLNLGLTNGEPFSARVLYERNHAVLSRARVAVFAVEPWQVARQGHVNERVRRFATLGQRLRWFDGPERLSLVVGALWRTLDAGVALRRLAFAPLRHPSPGLPIGEDGRVEWRDEEQVEALAKIPVGRSARRHWSGFSPSRGRLACLGELVERLRGDGIEVIVVQLPVRDGYWRQVESRWPDRLATYRRLVEGAVNEVAWMGEAAAEGLERADFYDYGHLTPSGAEKVTARIAQLLAPRLHAGGVRD
jgi:hypothetical protein